MQKVYENKDLMMYFKKRYCRCCGKPLSNRKSERVVKKGDPDHFEYCTIGNGFSPHKDILVVGVEYYCEHCDKAFSCEEQGEIQRAQKYFGRKIVSEDEVAFVNIDSDGSVVGTRERVDKKGGEKIVVLKKNRRYLWIPVIGLIMFSLKTKNKYYSLLDYRITRIITLFSIIIAEILYILIFRALKNANLLSEVLIKSSNIGKVIVALLVCNIPTIIHVNHRIKKEKQNNLAKKG